MRLEKDNEKILENSAYAKKQLFSKNAIIAWSHLSRFRLAKKLIQTYVSGRLLDYGCGDGTFLVLVRDLFPTAVGADIDPKQTQECRNRFSQTTRLNFIDTFDLVKPQYSAAFDIVICMEVLEHCVEDKQNQILNELRRLVTPNGHVIVSVPIEIGLSLLGKEIIRTIAAWQKIGDYGSKENYTFKELLKMVFADASTSIHRPVYRTDFSPERPHFFHGHKGFNWKSFKIRLSQQFEIEKTHFSPLGWLGGGLSSQAWFICKPKLKELT